MKSLEHGQITPRLKEQRENVSDKRVVKKMLGKFRPLDKAPDASTIAHFLAAFGRDVPIVALLRM